MGNKRTGQGLDETAVTPEGKEVFSLISNDKLLALYANLLKCRIALKQAAAGESRNKTQAGTFCGCEAGIVATTIDLRAEDMVSASDHTLLTGFFKGAAVESILHSFSRNGALKADRAKSVMGSDTRNGVKAPAAHHEPMHALIGAALANKTAENGRVAVVFECDAESDAWNQAIEIAKTHSLPIIFVSQSPDSTPAKQRAQSQSKNRKSETPHFPIITVDGHDVVAVYRVANESISRARKGRGPTLIECRPFQVEGNGKSNGHALDAVANMETYLSNKGLFSRKLKDEMLTNASQEMGK